MSVASVGPAARSARVPAAVVLLLLGEFVAIFDVSVVNVALPVIQREFGAATSGSALVVAAYAGTYACLLVTGGRIGDIHGFGRIFAVGIGVFGVASALCGVAPTLGVLLVGRVTQGVGAALLFPQVLAGINRLTDGAVHRRSVALFGAVLGVGSTLGQLVGGLITHLDVLGTSWRGIFVINVPICVVILVVGWSRFPLAPKSTERRGRLDAVGVALLALGLACWILPWPRIGGGLMSAIVLHALPGIALLGAFVAHERRASDGGSIAPLVSRELLDDARFRLGLLSCLTFFATQVPFYVLLARFAEINASGNTFDASLVYLPLGLGFLLSSLFSSRISASPAAVLPAAAAVIIGSFVGLLSLGHSQIHAGVIGPIVLLVANGVAGGLIAPTLMRTVLMNVPKAYSGVAAGALGTVQQIANSVGVVVIGAVYTASGPAIESSFRWVLLYCAAIAACFAAFALGLTRSRVRPSSLAVKEPS